jgi:amidase
MTRTVADAAVLLSVLVGVDQYDPATAASADYFRSDYTHYLDVDGLRGARIGVARESYFGYSPKADAIADAAIKRLRELGASIVDPADIPTVQQMNETASEMTVLLHEFKADLNQYLADLASSPVRSMAEIIAFNEEHAAEELRYFGQELFLRAQQTTGLYDPLYLQALAENHRLSRQEGIDNVMDRHNLDALIMPTGAPSWCIDVIDGDHPLGGSSQPAALAGYPAITVPAGFSFGLPVGLTFMGRAFSEPRLIQLAYAFEQATKVRQPPTFLETVAAQ